MKNKEEDRLHLINILLMAISLIIAINVPFELFLFAYAVLGPLHYLTEINWLNDKRFYIQDKKRILILVAMSALLSLPLFAHRALPYFEGSHYLISSSMAYISRFYGSILLLTFVIAAGLVYFQKLHLVALLVVAGGLIVFLFRNAEHYYLISALLLPSLIHVYVFTVFFMAYGVTKTRNRIGFMEVLFLLMVPVIIFFLQINPNHYSISAATLANFKESNFAAINMGIGKMVGVESPATGKEFVTSQAGIKIQIFIAFAYLYHYLNWFSKVSLIGWLKNTPMEKMIYIALLWVASIGLYWYDYRMGLSALFFLSLLHVILEFPLNIVSIQGVLFFIKDKLLAFKK